MFLLTIFLKFIISGCFVVDVFIVIVIIILFFHFIYYVNSVLL